MKSPVELNSLLLIFFVMSPGLIRRDTGRLANEASTSNPIVSSKQYLSGLKIKNCYILLTDQVSLSDCLYFLKHWAISALQLFISQVVLSQFLKLI